MGNVFCSEYRIHKRFDLKGSSHGRTTDKPRAEIDETTTLKDLDLNFVFRLEQSWFQELIRLDFANSFISLGFHFCFLNLELVLTFMCCLLLRQVDRDCEFLEAEGIMDYSLLIGLHFRDDCSVDEMKSSPRNSCSGICIVL